MKWAEFQIFIHLEHFLCAPFVNCINGRQNQYYSVTKILYTTARALFDDLRLVWVVLPCYFPKKHVDPKVNFWNLETNQLVLETVAEIIHKLGFVLYSSTFFWSFLWESGFFIPSSSITLNYTRTELFSFDAISMEREISKTAILWNDIK